MNRTQFLRGILVCLLANIGITNMGVAHADFPARRDVAQKAQRSQFEEPDTERFMRYINSLSWMRDVGAIETAQDRLFEYFFKKLGHETAEPAVPETQDLQQWHFARHSRAYRTELDGNGSLQVLPDQNAAWELIVEDLKVCNSVLRSGASRARKAQALAVLASNAPLMGAVMGDAHAARVAYQAFLIPNLHFANGGRFLWPAQMQILLDSYIWFERDAEFAVTSELAQLMIKMSDEWYDKRYNDTNADTVRYIFGFYVNSKGDSRRAVTLWREIKAPNLITGVKTLVEQAQNRIDSEKP